MSVHESSSEHKLLEAYLLRIGSSDLGSDSATEAAGTSRSQESTAVVAKIAPASAPKCRQVALLSKIDPSVPPSQQENKSTASSRFTWGHAPSMYEDEESKVVQD